MLLKNKTILITGGTGSFGEAVLKNFLLYNVKEIRVFSRDEKKQYDLRNSLKSKKVSFFIGDVRDYQSVNYAMKNVDFVFHAAALKQVPSCEFFPMEAIKTNVVGSDNVLNSAIENNVKKVIFLSTDKAVYPINAMGLSKALMEKNMISKSRFLKNTILCATRYGNVMGSRGSVIPLFLTQLLSKKLITLTNPNMTRFMMDLNDSVSLVLNALKFAKNGEIFVMKSSASSILNIIESLETIFNIKANIKIIGIRHGEKIFETLISEEEMIKTLSFGKYFKIVPDIRDLNYNKFFSLGKKNYEPRSYNSNNTNILTKKQLIKKLMKLDFIKKLL